jgi:copper/silver efflux system protein
VVLPSAVLLSIGLMHLLGINANIMSLGGIAIAVGVMVDCSIVMVENAHQAMALEKRRLGQRIVPPARRIELISEAAREVGPALFFSLLVITISFLPVFILGEQSGRLFRPLAYTKTFAMATAAVLAVTLIPVLMVYFLREEMLPGNWSKRSRILVIGGSSLLLGAVLAVLPLGGLEPWRWWIVAGGVVLAVMILVPQRIHAEDRNPISRALEAAYRPLFAASLRFRWLLLGGAALLVAVTFWIPFRQLGTEFMPPLEEGDLLYMPTTMEPGLSVTKAAELLQQTNKLIMTFPEVQRVKGKIGRAETATDPAPMNMIESTIILHRDVKRWRHIPRERFFTDWPGWARRIPAALLSESRPITLDELIHGFFLPDGSLIPGLDTVVQIPGLANSWTMPIRTRIDMLATGIRTPVGVKLLGPDLDVLSELASQVEQVLKEDESTGAFTRSAFSERTVGGRYIDIVPRRGRELERYGLTVRDVQETISMALGGMNVASTVEGLERYPINIRYPAELRDTIPMLRQVRVSTPDGGKVPLELVADIRITSGPPMIKSENARPTAWVYVDTQRIDVGTYVERARDLVRDRVPLPPGYSVQWSGQFEYIESARERFMIAIPLVLVVIAILLYLATRSWARVFLIFTTLSFSVVGAIWFLWLLDYNLSVAVAVGIIALLGLDAETSLIMLLYLDNSYERARREGRLVDRQAVWDAVFEGAVKRIRPKTMTVLTTIIGLLPLMFATGAGADTMRRLAAPMIGGLTTSFLLELLIYPAVYYAARLRSFKK